MWGFKWAGLRPIAGSSPGVHVAYFACICAHLVRSSGSDQIAGVCIESLQRGWGVQQLRHATKKAGGASKAACNPGNPKFLGVKRFGGNWVFPGSIILRQRGSKWYPGEGVGMGRDHTLFALNMGRVYFEQPQHAHQRKLVHITPLKDSRQKDRWEQMPYVARERYGIPDQRCNATASKN